MTKREREQIKNVWGLDDKDVDALDDEYRGNAKGKEIVCCVYKDKHDCAREVAYDLGFVKAESERYFDFDYFGDDVLESSSYLELPSGKVAYLNY